MSLEKPNCYDCKHYFICAFRESIGTAIKSHLGWVNVDMHEPDWQKIYVAVATACLRYDEQTQE